MVVCMKLKQLAPLILILTCLLGWSGCDKADALAKKRFVVGLATNNPNGLKNVQGFREGMEKLGYVEGKNIVYRFAGKYVKGEELNASLSSMVSEPVDLIFTAGTGTGVTAHKLAGEKNIPVVFGVIADPVKAGVLENLTHPGGHITGVMISQNQSKRFQYLLDVVPGIENVFILYNPDNSAASSAYAQVSNTARNSSVGIISREVRNEREVNQVLDNLPEGIDAIFMLPDSTVNRHQMKLIDNAMAKSIPVSGPSIIQVEKGALIAYGIAHKETGIQAAGVAHQVLKGIPPAELPVQVADFYLGINLKTAGKIGVKIDDIILQQAHTIVRTKD